jgi:hypothetical protein
MYLCIHYVVPAAAARVKHPAGYANIIYLLFIYCVVPAAAACFRHPAHDGGHYDFVYLFIIYLLFGACSGSMREESCGPLSYLFIIMSSLFSVAHSRAHCRTLLHCHTRTAALPYITISIPPYTAVHKKLRS